MSSRDPSVRQQAIQTVGTGVFQERTGEAGPAVIKALLNQQDSSCRVYAALTLAAMASNKRMGLHEEDVPQAVKALGEGLSYDGQAVVRFHSAIALGMFGDKARMAIPSLVGRVHDPSSWEIRRAVIAALGNVGRGPDPRAVRALANLLLGKEEYSSLVRLEAVLALGNLGRPASPIDQRLVGQALQVAKKDPDKAIQIWAWASQIAIERITTLEGTSFITQQLHKGKDVNIRVNAARALAALGPDLAKGRIPDLITALDDPEPVVVVAAILALGDLKTASTAAIAPLTKLLESKNDYIKQAAEEAIKKINGETK